MFNSLQCGFMFIFNAFKTIGSKSVRGEVLVSELRHHI